MVFEICKIDRDLYRVITSDIRTEEVIITAERIQHIKDNHPGDYEKFGKYFAEILLAPDFIIKSQRPNTALVLKTIESIGTKLILRLQTNGDPADFKNSILTFQRVSTVRYERYIKNDQVVYRRKQN